MISRRHALAMLTSLPAAPALAQPGTGPAGPGLFETGATTHSVTRHAFLSADGQRRYRVDMAMPKQRPPGRGWPSLYLLDGNAAFTILTPADLASVPNLALVAIGYETEQRFDNLARTFDYTPSWSGPPETPGRPEGGSAAFRELLLGDIRPRLERLGRLNPKKATIWGHSYGALFVMDTLRTDPDAFRTYVPVSPSLWWRDGAIAAAPFRSPRHSVRVALMVGDREARRTGGGAPPSLDDFAASIARVRALGESLAATPRLIVDVTVLPGQSHGGALTTSLPLALRIAAEDRP
ncbi:alpha/beta hydrolase-fold protein [Caulobacter segnis]|uniref:alpha/beta hydrolase n=1 Tax=Caulobacter segnis TaxID=88688 RepID=UPI002862F159|nr:alpha/beta hydrolase-fold protein [Caulobacter segnis]MDR6623848.1 putative alpha/beta superfamily hydrolase [Caulobacter segnis]